MPSKMPNQKSKLAPVSVQQKQRRQVVVGAGVATLVVGVMAIGIWKFFPGKSGKLDISNGVNLLPQDTLLSATISTDPERWQKFKEFGVPESRGVFEQQIAKIQTDFLTNYGYDYARDLQPWIGKQILFAYLNNPAASSGKSNRLKLPQQQSVIILPIANQDAAKKVLERHQTPIDANLVESSYKGVSIKETKRKSGTMAIAILDNFVAIATDRLGLQRVIDTQKGSKSLLAVPGYTKALTEIEIDRPFVQIYVNIPVATAVAAANSPLTLAPETLAQAQVQQGIAANATLESEGISWKGISWLRPNTKQKLVVENQGQNFANDLPASTLVMLSGGNLQKLWLDYVRSTESNPLAPLKPNDLVKNLDGLTGLELESEILNWSKGPFGVAMIPKSAPQEHQPDTEFGAGLVLLQQTTDRSAAEKAFAKLDKTIAQKQSYKVAKAKLGGKEIIEWSSPLGGVAATHGWLNNNLAFLSMGAPIAPSFVPQPQKSLAADPLFQQSTRSSLTAHNGQFFIDIDRTMNAGNLPLPLLSPEVIATFKAFKSLGVTSAIFDEYSNRFDMFVALKKVPGVVKLPPAPPKKVLKPSPSPSKSPS
jgi:Protein of unknown function (DUF3352)